ncbi:MAG: nitroreductase family protein [Candidatus Acidiferrales bacterium]
MRAMVNKTTVERPAAATPGCGVTHFERRLVPPDLLEHILEAGCQAQSAWNLRPWQFIVVRSEVKRDQVLRHCVESGPAATAPVLVVGIANPRAWKQAPERLAELTRHGRLAADSHAAHLGRIHRQWSVGDAARVLAIAQTHGALQQICASAASHSLCAYWVNEFDAAALARTLHVPETLVMVGVLALGFCDQPPTLPRASLSRTIFSEAYGLPWELPGEVEEADNSNDPLTDWSG